MNTQRLIKGKALGTHQETSVNKNTAMRLETRFSGEGPEFMCTFLHISTQAHTCCTHTQIDKKQEDQASPEQHLPTMSDSWLFGIVKDNLTFFFSKLSTAPSSTFPYPPPGPETVNSRRSVGYLPPFGIIWGFWKTLAWYNFKQSPYAVSELNLTTSGINLLYFSVGDSTPSLRNSKTEGHVHQDTARWAGSMVCQAWVPGYHHMRDGTENQPAWVQSTGTVWESKCSERQRQAHLCDIIASPIYIVTSKLAEATRDPVSKKKSKH